MRRPLLRPAAAPEGAERHDDREVRLLLRRLPQQGHRGLRVAADPEALSTILKLIRARLCEPEGLAELEDKIRSRIDALRREFGSDSRSLEQKLGDIDRRIQNYFNAIGEGLDAATCRAKIAELTTKKEELEREANLVRQEDFLRKALERNITELRRFAEVFADGFDDLPFERKRQVVLQFIEKIEVVERRRIRITFTVPFDSTGLRHLIDEVVVPHADTSESEAVKMPTILDGNDCAKGGVRVAI